MSLALAHAEAKIRAWVCQTASSLWRRPPLCLLLLLLLLLRLRGRPLCFASSSIYLPLFLGGDVLTFGQLVDDDDGVETTTSFSLSSSYRAMASDVSFGIQLAFSQFNKNKGQRLTLALQSVACNASSTSPITTITATANNTCARVAADLLWGTNGTSSSSGNGLIAAFLGTIGPASDVAIIAAEQQQQQQQRPPLLRIAPLWRPSSSASASYSLDGPSATPSAIFLRPSQAHELVALVRYLRAPPRQLQVLALVYEHAFATDGVVDTAAQACNATGLPLLGAFALSGGGGTDAAINATTIHRAIDAVVLRATQLRAGLEALLIVASPAVAASVVAAMAAAMNATNSGWRAVCAIVSLAGIEWWREQRQLLPFAAINGQEGALPSLVVSQVRALFACDPIQ